MYLELSTGSIPKNRKNSGNMLKKKEVDHDGRAVAEAIDSIIYLGNMIDWNYEEYF